jgi:hypothetical protein
MLVTSDRGLMNFVIETAVNLKKEYVCIVRGGTLLIYTCNSTRVRNSIIYDYM